MIRLVDKRLINFSLIKTTKRKRLILKWSRGVARLTRCPVKAGNPQKSQQHSPEFFSLSHL